MKRPTTLQGGGFSLVEILVAIAVVGALASIAIPSIRGVPDAAKKKKLDRMWPS